MRGTHRLVVTALFLSAASGCREPNPYHCPGGSECLGDVCGSQQCRAPTPVCQVETTTCVECVEPADCAPERPICSSQNTCVECVLHGDCESGLCLPDQRCAAPEEVAFVDGAAPPANIECSAAMPCSTLQKTLLLVPPPLYIKATGMITSDSVINLDRRTLSIFGAPGMTTIARTGGMAVPVFDIKKSSVVTLVDLELIAAADGNAVTIKEAPGPMVSMTRVKVRGDKDNGIQIEAGKLEFNESQVSGAELAGINLIGGSLVMTGSQVFGNAGDGVKAVAGTTVDILASSIRNNGGTAGVSTTDASMVAIDSSIITGNAGAAGGVALTGPFTIRNSIITRNGSFVSTTGGLALSSSSGVLEFNTIADNVAGAGGTGGVSCSGTVLVSSSILTNNSGNAASGCNVTYSLTGTTGSPLPGAGNVTGEPMFLATADPLAPAFYRIGSTSAARNKADSTAFVDVDIDGQPRDDGAKDMGADEFKEP